MMNNNPQELEVQGHLTLEWEEPRIKKENVSKDLILDPGADLQRLWVPDVWIRLESKDLKTYLIMLIL